MPVNRLYAIYFSPTGGTKRIVLTIAGKLAEYLNLELTEIDYTNMDNRKRTYNFGDKDLVVMGFPVYAGRIPNKILPDIEAGIHGSGTKAVPISVYGNRNYDEALRELVLLSERNGFVPIAGAAIVSQHAFSEILAANRPDETDIQKMEQFAKRIAGRIRDAEDIRAIEIDRSTPIKPYYTPLKTDGSPAGFLKAKPVTNMEKCDNCGLCAEICPMDSISREDVSRVTGVCIKCQACIRGCPKKAKAFEDEAFLSHVEMLEQNYRERREDVFWE